LSQKSHGKEIGKWRRRWWALEENANKRVGPHWNKILYGLAILFIILGVAAEPVSGAVSGAVSEIPLVGPTVGPWLGSVLSPVSEIFTPEVTSVQSFTMLVGENFTTTIPASNQTIRIGDVNVTEHVPAHEVTKTPYVWDIGEGQFALSGKGSLSEDTELTIDVTFFIREAVVSNFSGATMTFHPFGARSIPLVTDALGAPVYANLTVSPVGTITDKFGLAIGEKWDSGPQPAEWFLSGSFDGQVAFHNGFLKQADNVTRFTSSETPKILNLIEIDSAQVGATVRTNELATSLSFFILALTSISLRRSPKDKRDECKDGERDSDNQSNPSEQNADRVTKHETKQT